MEAHHQTHSLLEEADEIQGELDEVLKCFKAGELMRGRVNGVLQAKLKALQAQIADNNKRRQKIQSAIVCCEEIAKLSTGMKTSAVIRKKIEQMKKEMKGEVEHAKNFLNRVAPEQVTLFTKLILSFNSIIYSFIINSFYILMSRARQNDQSQSKVLLGDQPR